MDFLAHETFHEMIIAYKKAFVKNKNAKKVNNYENLTFHFIKAVFCSFLKKI